MWEARAWCSACPWELSSELRVGFGAGFEAGVGAGAGVGPIPLLDLEMEQARMSLVALLDLRDLREQAVKLRVRRQERVTVFGVAVLKLTQAVEVKPPLLAFVAAVVHTAEVAGGPFVVCSVALVSAAGHYTEDSLLCLLVATVSAGAWERERCSGGEKAVGRWAEMQEFLVFGASGGSGRVQEQHAAIAGADAAADGSVDTVDAVVDN